jgi:hypothetical protein
MKDISTGCLVAVICLFLLILFLDSEPANTTPQPQSAPTVITAEKYAALETGMRYYHVVQKMGSPGREMGRNKIGDIETIAYAWVNPDGSNVYVIMQNNELTSKSQYGLQSGRVR